MTSVSFTCKHECYVLQDSVEVRWEAFALCYGKFNQENMYQILSESASFCKRYDKNILVCFFGSQCMHA